MKIKSFEFNMQELAGSMGDLGTLLPLAIGYMVVCGLDPSGLLVMMGVANIATGLVYRLPMPIEPMKVIALAAIAQHWSPSMVYASGFSMGVIWVVIAMTGIIGWIARVTPLPVVRGIQITLGILLAFESYKMLATWWIVGIVSIGIVLVLRKNRYAPAAIVLVAMGIVIMAVKGQFSGVSAPAFTLPSLTGFGIDEVWRTLLLAGFAQVPLTVTNATIATSALIADYFPEKRVSERRLSVNQGLMNAVAPFFGGMPMCHGAGGLAGQYFFGARTGGANIIEGTIELLLGLFLAGSIGTLFSVFPLSIVGAMMLMVGLELLKFVKDIEPGTAMVPLVVTVAVSLAGNMAFGFLAGLAIHHGGRFIAKKMGREWSDESKERNG